MLLDITTKIKYEIFIILLTGNGNSKLNSVLIQIVPVKKIHDNIVNVYVMRITKALLLI